MSLSHLQWRATEWLLAFGPLSPAIVMDYFVMSPFFDRTSNNAVLRMQMQFSRGGMEGVDEEVELKRFVGVEYAVVHAAPPSLFIIHQRDRTSPAEATTTAVYYILNDNVYQSPSLYSVINERLLTSLHSLSSSFSLLRANKPSWSPTTLYAWDIKPPHPSAVISAPALSLESSTPAIEPGTPAVVEETSAKRPREDDDAERPASTFNPVLFRALQSVAAGLPVPPMAPLQEVEVLKERLEAKLEETQVEPPVEEKKVAEKEPAKGVRIGPTGRRKPKGAA